MAFNLSKLATLAASVEKAGAPILGAALRAGSAISGAAPFPLSLVLPSVLGSLADAVGGMADDPASIVAKIDGSPEAAAKIQAVEESHKDDLTNTLDMLKLQTDQNEAELNVNAPLWARLLYSGWRPLMGWISGPVLMAYQIGAVTFGGHPCADGNLRAGYGALDRAGGPTHQRKMAGRRGASADGGEKPGSLIGLQQSLIDL